MLGLKKYLDPNFNQEISWGNLGLDQFDHHFLNGDSVIYPDKNLDAPKLNGALKQFQPDLLIIYGYFQKLQRRAYLWAKSNKVKLAYISDSELRHHRNWLKEKLKYFFIRKFFSGINYFLSVGDANEEFYLHYGVGQDRIIRMHFPIDVMQFEARFLEKDKLRKQLRKQYEIGENEVVLSVVGKLVPWKNQDHIVDALKLLEDEGLFMHLIILGSGKLKEVWEKKSMTLRKSKVHFAGFVGVEELPAYYATTDIYVHPASVEPHSIAISEAIYMGCPVIISNRCGSFGVSDDVQDCKNGYIFEFGNIQQLAEKIRVLIKNENTRKEFGEYSHKIAMQFQNNAHYEISRKIMARISKDSTSN